MPKSTKTKSKNKTKNNNKNQKLISQKTKKTYCKNQKWECELEGMHYYSKSSGLKFIH